MELQRVWAGLECLGAYAYRDLYRSPLLLAFRSLLRRVLNADRAALSAYTEFFSLLKEEGCLGLGDWLWDILRYTDSPYGLLCERGGRDPDLERSAQQDVEALVAAAQLSCDQLLQALAPTLPAGVTPDRLPRWQSGADFDFAKLTHFYVQNGCGLFAKYRAFRWSGGKLVGIPQPDSPQPWELWGYEAQRRQVRANAQALVEGRRVNHVLLYGDSGTGKSATVKSLLSQPGLETLRVIELDKTHLEDIPALVRTLDGRMQKFILFIDDLAFDSDDKAYSQLKTILEGSLEKPRDNVVVYATSNRRNLVKQNFSDRAGDEVDVQETIAEKTSLAERFGLRVFYQSLTPSEFRRMIVDLAQLYGLTLDRETLLQRAEQWELRHPGRTPRIAKQFISYELDRQAQ